MSLQGRVAILTGATGGIGQAIAGRLIEEGMKLVLAGRTTDWRGPADTVYLTGDITQEGYAQSLAHAAVDEFGGLDVLVNCHGLDFHSQLESTEVDEARQVFEVNFLGVLLTMKYAAPLMRARGSGSIINMGSRLGQVAIPGQAVYGASKAAVAQLSRGAAIDLAADGIRVNCVAPGITNTEMIGAWVREQPDPTGFERSLVESIPMRRMASPEDIAGAVAFLAGDDARYITGAVLSVDGGYTAQ